MTKNVSLIETYATICKKKDSTVQFAPPIVREYVSDNYALIKYPD